MVGDVQTGSLDNERAERVRCPRSGSIRLARQLRCCALDVGHDGGGGQGHIVGSTAVVCSSCELRDDYQRLSRLACWSRSSGLALFRSAQTVSLRSFCFEFRGSEVHRLAGCWQYRETLMSDCVSAHGTIVVGGLCRGWTVFQALIAWDGLPTASHRLARSYSVRLDVAGLHDGDVVGVQFTSSLVAGSGQDLVVEGSGDRPGDHHGHVSKLRRSLDIGPLIGGAW